MFLVGSKGTFRAHKEHMVLELRAHRKHVPLKLRAQQTAHSEPKVVILAIFIRITVNKFKLPNLKYYIAIFYYDSEEIYFMS